MFVPNGCHVYLNCHRCMHIAVLLQLGVGGFAPSLNVFPLVYTERHRHVGIVLFFCIAEASPSHGPQTKGMSLECIIGHFDY
jgi:hypothetical protein